MTPFRLSPASRSLSLAVGLCLLFGCSVFPDAPPIKSEPVDPGDAADAADLDVSAPEASPDADDEADAPEPFDALLESDAQDAADSSGAMDAVDAIDTSIEADSSDALDADASPNVDDGGHCSNTVVDGDETDMNCGGLVCPKCTKNQHCLVDSDCQVVCNQAAQKCKE
jgi:hypothetical protein